MPDNDKLDVEGVRQMIAFDPFEPGAFAKAGSSDEGKQDQGTAEGKEETPSPKPDGKAEAPVKEGAAGGSPPADAAPSPSTEKPDEGKKTPEAGKDEDKDRALDTLKGMVSRLLEQTTAAPAKEEKTEPAKPEPKPGETKPDEAKPYQLSVPQQVVDAMASDDPAVRQHAVSALINASMNQIYRDFKQALDTMKQEMAQAIAQRVPEVIEQREASRRVEDDFYQAFPALGSAARSNRMIRDAMWQVIQQSFQATKQAEWNEDFRNQMGEYLHLTLGIPKAAVAATPAPGGNGSTPPKKAPFAVGSGGSAGAGRGAADAKTQEFLDVVFAGQ